MTAVTVVCCSMISDSQTRYGSAIRPGSARQGRTRRWRSYQASSARAGKVTDNDTHKDMTPRDITKVWRPVHGPRPIAALVPVVAKTAFRRGGQGTAHLMEAWSGIVGPILADLTIPRSLSQGTLTIGCSGPVAMELQHLSTELLNRVNQYLGAQTVHRLRFVQIRIVRAPPKPRPPPSPAAEKAAEAAVAHLPEGPLRTALAALGRAVHSESASRLGKQPNTRF